MQATLPPLYASPPLIGILPEIRRDALGFMRKLVAIDAPIVRYRMGPMHAQLAKHPDALKRVLQEHVRNYTKDHISYKMTRWVTGEGILVSQGDFWLRQRRLAAPAFHRQRIAGLVTMITDATEAMLTEWDKLPDGSIVDVEQTITALTLTIVGRALFGAQVGPDAAIVSEAFTELSAQLVGRFRTGNVLKPWAPFGADARWKRATTALDTVVMRIIAARRQDEQDHGDLLSMLMLAQDADTGERMGDQHIRNEVLTMLLAGHETTATLLMWTFALLGHHPAIEDRLRAELTTQLHAPPGFDDLARIPYSRMVLDETLRLKPPVYVLSRHVAADDELCGLHIPAGSMLDISPYVTHRLPEFWPSPETFDPERFAPGHEQSRPRYAYIPFLGGPRQCIGNTFALTEAQVILATILQRYRLRPLTATLPAEEALITLRPRGGLRMRLERC